MAHDTRDLVERARQGDRAAFEDLFHEFEVELRQFVQVRIGAHLARVVSTDDVIQETAVRALKAVGGFDWRGERSLLHWLRGIAEHVILTEVRRHGRGKLLYVERETADSIPSPSKVMQRDERFERLRAAVADLPENYREVVLLRVEGLRVKEIAARLGRTPKAVSLVLARAMQKLKERFGDTESLSLPPGDLRTTE